MKLSAEISGKRPGTVKAGAERKSVSVLVSLDNGSIEFSVPALERASGLTFEVDRGEFDAAYSQLSAVEQANAPKLSAARRSRRGTGHVEPEADNAA